jgi:hypothetical protein
MILCGIPLAVISTLYVQASEFKYTKDRGRTRRHFRLLIFPFQALFSLLNKCIQILSRWDLTRSMRLRSIQTLCFSNERELTAELIHIKTQNVGDKHKKLAFSRANIGRGEFFI